MIVYLHRPVVCGPPVERIDHVKLGNDPWIELIQHRRKHLKQYFVADKYVVTPEEMLLLKELGSMCGLMNSADGFTLLGKPVEEVSDQGGSSCDTILQGF